MVDLIDEVFLKRPFGAAARDYLKVQEFINKVVDQISDKLRKRSIRASLGLLEQRIELARQETPAEDPYALPVSMPRPITVENSASSQQVLQILIFNIAHNIPPGNRMTFRFARGLRYPRLSNGRWAWESFEVQQPGTLTFEYQVAQGQPFWKKTFAPTATDHDAKSPKNTSTDLRDTDMRVALGTITALKVLLTTGLMPAWSRDDADGTKWLQDELSLKSDSPPKLLQQTEGTDWAEYIEDIINNQDFEKVRGYYANRTARPTDPADLTKYDPDDILSLVRDCTHLCTLCIVASQSRQIRGRDREAGLNTFEKLHIFFDKVWKLNDDVIEKSPTDYDKKKARQRLNDYRKYVERAALS